MIFVHVPKCAGNAICHALYGKDSIEIAGHSTGCELKAADPSAFLAAFKFTVVRCPFTRFTSAFRFLQAGGMTPTDREWARVFLPDQMSLEAFTTKLRKLQRYRRSVMRYFHFRPQRDFICDSDGALMVDMLIKQENLNADYEVLRSKLGRGNDLKVVNRTQSGCQDALSDSAKYLIRELYNDDFKIGEYIG